MNGKNNERLYQRFGKPTAWLRRYLMRKQKGNCLDCGIPDYDLDRALDIHRLIPGDKGGEYHAENCVLLCQTCHKRRHLS